MWREKGDQSDDNVRRTWPTAAGLEDGEARGLEGRNVAGQPREAATGKEAPSSWPLGLLPSLILARWDPLQTSNLQQWKVIHLGSFQPLRLRSLVAAGMENQYGPRVHLIMEYFSISLMTNEIIICLLASQISRFVKSLYKAFAYF